MGPKPNRTKGNAKASSSAAASEFVARAQTASPVLVGFQTLQQNPVLLAAGKVSPLVLGSAWTWLIVPLAHVISLPIARANRDRTHTLSLAGGA